MRFSLEPASDHAEVEALWRGLEARTDATFFLTWRWIGAWLAETRSAPWLLCGRSGTEVVLLALLTVDRRRELGVFPITTARLHETGDPSEDTITIEYNNFLVSQAWRGPADIAAIHFLLGGDHKMSIDELRIRGAADGSVALDADRWIVSAPTRSPSWQVDLQAVRGSEKSYLDQLSSNTRQQIRRAMRLYEKQGDLSIDKATDLESALDYFAGLKDLHQRYWLARGKPGAFAHAFFEKFHDRIIRDCIDTGNIEMVRITAGDTVLGYLYNFIHDGYISSYQSGFAYQDDPKLKPGLISHSLCIQSHVNTDGKIYDFLAGGSQYKASLGHSGPDMVQYVMQRRDPKMHVWNAVRSAGRKVKAALHRQPG
ncbi:GNAT family N-acetyltransferase [Humitalea sp. 24SJ18S-53]|uniref:GNAT family N-acetyltransferase n=1 Tax=Humitalea sp. 24SJ18S-53 TaxID=3422307 RepID=UPI003D66EBFC